MYAGCYGKTLHICTQIGNFVHDVTSWNKSGQYSRSEYMYAGCHGKTLHICHQHPINKVFHKVCVPTIFICSVALLFNLHPIILGLFTIGAAIFYFSLSLKVMLGMAAFFSCIVTFLVFYPVTWWVWLLIFGIAWVGQFIGHHVEGKKPSFFTDLLFLLIGPVWVFYSILGIAPPPQKSE
ncbi:PRS2 protein-related protein [Trichomonas vaginalis G3]|uniref:PRS2 protein-related protein n=1 Tax=Trichomonas vaginalis (strain ATCC PRA-98 / G3) TaxID=412133 RepID=A2FFA7_TRIV3|nr:protein of unknown function, DUF962 [Trichomonas vaginalis G3]EAX96399.1 PRS2 protein-related protein [Trichomonas vaginalis G3]KAI5514560.1 protein of unknown function, DUF962 [Trichomonas vaginalis G3]|eukprot:XP_001309329.1 PRS2 protein-related protein [Trichomonas vaginalis G3]